MIHYKNERMQVLSYNKHIQIRILYGSLATAPPQTTNTTLNHEVKVYYNFTYSFPSKRRSRAPYTSCNHSHTITGPIIGGFIMNLCASHIPHTFHNDFSFLHRYMCDCYHRNIDVGFVISHASQICQPTEFSSYSDSVL